MEILLIALLAGVLTAFAPCTFILLPVILGGSLVEQSSWKKPLVIIASLAVSLLLFTLLLKASTALLGVPQAVWQIIAGGIVLLLGITMFWPVLWEKAALRLGVTGRLPNSKAGAGRDILTGAALGPVFNSCSPTYALLVAVILPQSFATGVAATTAYIFGLCAVLLLVALSGQALTRRLKGLANPNGPFRKVLGILFIIVGIVVITGLDKQLQTAALDAGLYKPFERIEQRLLL